MSESKAPLCECGCGVRTELRMIAPKGFRRYATKTCSDLAAGRALLDRKQRGIKQRQNRVWKPGDKVGGAVLMCHVKGSGMWRLRMKCGHVTNGSPSGMLKRDHMEDVGLRCHPCWSAFKTLPRVCVSCGTTDVAKFSSKATECMACERRRLRNGACPTCKTPLRGGLVGRFGVPTCPRCVGPVVVMRNATPRRGTCACGKPARVKHCSDRCRVRAADQARRQRGRLERPKAPFHCAALKRRAWCWRCRKARPNMAHVPKPTCSVPRCASVVEGDSGMCGRHVTQVRRYGEVVPDNANGIGVRKHA